MKNLFVVVVFVCGLFVTSCSNPVEKTTESPKEFVKFQLYSNNTIIVLELDSAEAGKIQLHDMVTIETHENLRGDRYSFLAETVVLDTLQPFQAEIDARVNKRNNSCYDVKVREWVLATRVKG